MARLKEHQRRSPVITVVQHQYSFSFTANPSSYGVDKYGIALHFSNDDSVINS
jgi:hypothetical protein